MASFKNMLLCYDSTLEGRRALIRGADLAQMLSAETHLLAIAGTIVGGAMVDQPSPVALRHEEQTVREVLREGVERLRGRGLIATGHLAFGRPVEQIAAMAHDLAVDLIVIGHRPRAGLARWWAGPGNVQLLDLVSCSVLVCIDPSEAGAPPAP
jgi:nucleotide-binding universal stress UspA family protein